MGNIKFVLGGARSGKSLYAESLVKDLGGRVAYLATCVPYDDEMKERVKIHQAQRPFEWDTYEEPIKVAEILQSLNNKYDTVLIDCMTLFVTNLIMESLEEPEIKSQITWMMNVLKEVNFTSIIVSNEVGLGIVPENSLSRKFRDIAGRTNQMLAAFSDEVSFVISGIPVKIKG
jgi:adenosylcobinamide kinase/adenosylcobinamide-phosphate guanylyltransferase